MKECAACARMPCSVLLRLSGLPVQLEVVAHGVPPAALTELLQILAEALGDSPHVEFLLQWVRALCLRHGTALQVCPRLHVPCMAKDRGQPPML